MVEVVASRFVEIHRDLDRASGQAMGVEIDVPIGIAGNRDEAPGHS